MIILKKIRFRNFLSTGNSYTEFTLNAHDTMLIVGVNGAGKSTLLDAISFALFGRPFRKINKPQLVNAIIKKNCLVEIEFSIGSIDYKVRRGITPAIFEVYQDGKLLNQVAATRDYQEILEKDILKASHKSFCQVVLLGAATYQPFMRLTAAQRREVIEDLLDLQVFTAMNAVLKERYQSVLHDLGSMLNEQEVLEDKLEIYKRHQTHLVEDKKEKRDDLHNQLSLLVWEKERTKEEIVKLEEQLEGHEALSRKLENYAKVQRDVTYNRDRLLEEIKFLETEATCPTCAQIIDQGFRYRKITVKRARVQECDEGLKELQKRYNEAALKLAEFTEIKKQINNYTVDIQVISNEITSATNAIKRNEEDLLKLSTVEDISRTEGAIAQLSEQIKALEQNRELMNTASVLLKDGGIKAEIIKKYIPLINKYINKYLREFELPCRFELDETFNETISWSTRRDIFSYESFSTGERQGIDFSILFAWRAIAKMRNTINVNLLILDEVFDTYQDYMAIDFLMTIIQVFARENNVIVITHKEQWIDKFETTVKIEKYRNFSRISKA